MERKKTHSEPLRRSERIRQKILGVEDDQPNTTVKPTAPMTTASVSNGENGRISTAASTKTGVSRVSQIRLTEMEFAIQKKKLEQEELKKKQELLEEELKKKQELLDLQLAFKIAQIAEESGAEKELQTGPLSVHESIKPDMEKWALGHTPWNFRQHLDDECSVITPKRYFDSHLNKQPPTTNHIESVSLPQISKLLVRQSLPRDLPIFDGNPIDWPNFIQQYRNSNVICDFSNEENQSRLQKCLKGNAKRVCQSLLIMPQNVEKVIDLLQSRFGRPEHIISLLISKLKQFPHLKNEQVDQLIEFADEVKNFIATIQSLDEEDHLQNPMLLSELVNKLPISYKISWTEHLSRLHPKFKLLEFANWLDRKSNILCQVQPPTDSNKYDKFNLKSNSKNIKTVVTTTTKNNDNSKNCICCRQSSIHNLSFCPKFNSLSVNERWSFVTSQRVCFSCLTPFHNIKQCRKRRSCGVRDCKKPHHELLHKDDMESVNSSTKLSSYEASPSMQAASSATKPSTLNNAASPEANCHISNKKCVLLKILPVIVRHGNLEVQTFALLDDASTITLVDKSFSESLKLSGPSQPLTMQWTNDDLTRQESDSKIVSFTIKGIDTKQSFQLRHVRTLELSLSSQSVDVHVLKTKYPYINNKITSMVNAQPKIIIGQDNWPLIIPRKVITGPWNGPALSKTLLGWVIHGNLSDDQTSRQHLCYIRTQIDEKYDSDILHGIKDDLDLLHDMVKETWKIDDVQGGKNKPFSPEDKRAETILHETMRRVGNRYETGLLWKNYNTVLPESKTNALKRLKCTERKMDRDEEYGKTYCEKFLDLEKKKYIRKLSTEEAAVQSDRTWYLPHFGTVNPNKPKKLRIVFDAAAKSNGVSLNDFLLSGPDLYNSLFTILLNFRIKKYAFTADIREMFLQVLVRKDDCCAQRILWRGMDRQQIPDVYEIDVVFFGSTCGPCLAQEAKNQNARDFKNNYPEAARCIIEEHYMDDFLGGADSFQESIKLIKDVIFVHKQGGFVICNWISNSKEILQNIDQDLVAEGFKNLKMNDGTTSEKILGVFWNPEKDTFEFKTKFHKIDHDILNLKRRPTKREILKVVMSVFDPLGFLANILIRGKVLLQDIWRSQIGWDDEITNTLSETWQYWVHDLKQIYDFQIPRRYFTLNRHKSNIQLHIFCDASERCYAAVAYLRIQEDDEVQIGFVCAKTRVAPLKPLSIPRLELQAALMGARLGSALKNDLGLSIVNTFYWSDSKTVLYWIRSEARRFKVFVSQRLGEIQELTNSSEWRYVNSRNNVADEATKRVSSSSFDKNCRWINGPEFLTLPFDKWPREQDTIDFNSNILEIKQTDNIHVITEKGSLEVTLPDTTRFSKWSQLVRCTAYIYRFAKALKERRKITEELQVNELNEAETTLFKKVQFDCFSTELKILKSNKTLPPSSKLFTLSPLYSTDGLIRLSGRLDNSSLNISTVRPIILDPSHNITKLLVQKYHEDFQHFGQETVINSLRQKFWIFKIRQTVKNAKQHCQYCKIKKGKPEVPLMGQLPTCRVEPTVRPFIKTGVDYFGPLEVKVKRTHEKRYGVIFTCMATRAIHLEIAHDLSTNEFINVLRQFGCRRGFPEEIYSDNGSNFRGADKELGIEFEKLNQNEIMKFCALKKTKFLFNPALAPNMGGSWERLIQCVKNVLREILKTKFPPENVLRTLLLECENIINSRPLTHVSMDPADPEALTPNHFLIGPSYAALPCAATSEQDLNLISSWRAAQKLADHFWTRWTKEYVPTLIKRSKWFSDKKSVNVGDIVILVDPNGPRNNWQKAKIVAVHQARDGKIRVVDVKNSSGTIFRRPVSKLIILDVHRK